MSRRHHGRPRYGRPRPDGPRTATGTAASSATGPAAPTPTTPPTTHPTDVARSAEASSPPEAPLAIAPEHPVPSVDAPAPPPSAPRPNPATPPPVSANGSNGATPNGNGAVSNGCTAPQLRRFIKSRPYVPMHELRRRFAIAGDDDDVTGVALEDGTIFVGLPSREGALLGELLRGGEIGYELSLDPWTPIVIGVYPMRPIPRG